MRDVQGETEIKAKRDERVTCRSVDRGGGRGFVFSPLLQGNLGQLTGWR